MMLHRTTSISVVVLDITTSRKLTTANFPGQGLVTGLLDLRGSILRHRGQRLWKSSSSMISIPTSSILLFLLSCLYTNQPQYRHLQGLRAYFPPALQFGLLDPLFTMTLCIQGILFRNTDRGPKSWIFDHRLVSQTVKAIILPFAKF